MRAGLRCAMPSLCPARAALARVTLLLTLPRSAPWRRHPGSCSSRDSEVSVSVWTSGRLLPERSSARKEVRPDRAPELAGKAPRRGAGVRDAAHTGKGTVVLVLSSKPWDFPNQQTPLGNQWPCPGPSGGAAGPTSLDMGAYLQLGVYSEPIIQRKPPPTKHLCPSIEGPSPREDQNGPGATSCPARVLQSPEKVPGLP